MSYLFKRVTLGIYLRFFQMGARTEKERVVPVLQVRANPGKQWR